MSVESPSWMRGELRRVSGLHHRGAFDATEFVNAKAKIINDALQELQDGASRTPPRFASKKKINAYCNRLHLSTSKRTLRYEDSESSRVVSQRRRWRPTGALVQREHPEEKQMAEVTTSCAKCTKRARSQVVAKPSSAEATTTTNTSAGSTSASSFQTHHRNNRGSTTTVASSIRLNQLAKAKPHPWWTTPIKTLYKSQRPSSETLNTVHYNLQAQLGSTVSPSPWPIFRRDQEENGLSEASCSVVKITHPVLLYRAQKDYAERMEFHYDSTGLDKMKLPPLDNIPEAEFERY